MRNKKVRPLEAALDHLQKGNIWAGIGQAGLAVSDVFLVLIQYMIHAVCLREI
jgi:hypothetical protein